MYERVASASEIREGDIVPVTVAGVDMILYRNQGAVYAAQRRCLHQGADLSDGILSGGFIVCAQHGWRFHADTGVHEMAAENCLATFAVRVEGDDLFVDPTPIRRGRTPAS